MKLTIKNVFENLNAKAMKAIEKKVLKARNDAFDESGLMTATNGEHHFSIIIKENTKNLSNAALLINLYFQTFAGKNVNKISESDIVTLQNESTGEYKYSVEYQLNWFKKLKESMKSKNNKAILVNEDGNTTFAISPGELLGKLHLAAMEQVSKKFGNDVTLLNTAVDTNKNPPVATTEEGDYKIQIAILKSDGDKKKDRELSRDVLKTYLTVFAGADVANKANKPKWYLITKKDQVKDESDGKGFSVHYTMGTVKVDPSKNEGSFWERVKQAFKDAGTKISNSAFMKDVSKVYNDIKTKIGKFAKTTYDKTGLKKYVEDFKKDRDARKKTIEILDKLIAEIRDIEELIKMDMYEQVSTKVVDKLSHDDFKLNFTGANLTSIILAGVQKHQKVIAKNLRLPDKNKTLLEKSYDEIADEIYREIKARAEKKAANESIFILIDGCQPMLVEANSLVNNLNLILESKNMNERYQLVNEGIIDKAKQKLGDMKKAYDQKKAEKKAAKEKAKAEKEHLKKIGFTITTATLVGKLHKAAVNAFNKKYGKKCIVINTAIDEDQDPPQAKMEDGTYKITIKQLKPGLFGSTKAAREAAKIYLETFAGADVAKQVTKVPFFSLKLTTGGQFDDSKLGKGKLKDNAGKITGYTLYYDLKMESGSNKADESFSIKLKDQPEVVVECRKRYEQIIKESMKKKSISKANSSEKLLNYVVNGKNLKANTVLEKILNKKVSKRLDAVLGE